MFGKRPQATMIGGLFDQFLGEHIAKTGESSASAQMIRTQLERQAERTPST